MVLSGRIDPKPNQVTSKIWAHFVLPTKWVFVILATRLKMVKWLSTSHSTVCIKGYLIFLSLICAVEEEQIQMRAV